MDGKIRYKITDTELEGVIESADTFVHHVQSYTLYYVNTTNADDPVFVQFNMDYWSDVTQWFRNTQFTVVDLDPTVSTQQVYLDFYDNLKDDVNKPYIYFTDDYRNYRHIVDSARDMENVENSISETVSSFVTNTTEWTPPTGTGLTRGRVFKDFIRTRLTQGATTTGELLTLTKTQLQELITLPNTAKFSLKMDEDVITLRIMSNEQAVTILGNETVYIPFSTISEIHVGSHILQVEVQADKHTYHVKQKVPGSTRFDAVEMNESATYEGATFTMDLKSNGLLHTVTFVWNSVLVDVVTDGTVTGNFSDDVNAALGDTDTDHALIQYVLQWRLSQQPLDTSGNIVWTTTNTRLAQLLNDDVNYPATMFQETVEVTVSTDGMNLISDPTALSDSVYTSYLKTNGFTIKDTTNKKALYASLLAVDNYNTGGNTDFSQDVDDILALPDVQENVNGSLVKYTLKRSLSNISSSQSAVWQTTTTRLQ